MRTFSTTFLADIKSISIANYLESKGIEPTESKGKEFLYFSPLREEKTASFRVNTDKNLWQDFGNGQGDSVIGLVMLLEHLTFVEAVNFLADFTGTREESHSFSFSCPKPKTENPTMEIVKVKELQNLALIDYLNTRHIPFEIAKTYLKEIYYKANEKNYFALSLENNSKGYAIRNKYFKGNIGTNDFTLIKGKNEKNISIFEGFMDFLSAFVFYQVQEPNNDTIILNSINNLSRAKELIKNYSNIFLFLDNDSIGQKTAQVLKQEFENVEDFSKVYQNHKDFNDFLTGL